MHKHTPIWLNIFCIACLFIYLNTNYNIFSYVKTNNRANLYFSTDTLTLHITLSRYKSSLFNNNILQANIAYMGSFKSTQSYTIIYFWTTLHKYRIYQFRTHQSNLFMISKILCKLYAIQIENTYKCTQYSCITYICEQYLIICVICVQYLYLIVLNI